MSGFMYVISPYIKTNILQEANVAHRADDQAHSAVAAPLAAHPAAPTYTGVVAPLSEPKSTSQRHFTAPPSNQGLWQYRSKFRVLVCEETSFPGMPKPVILKSTGFFLFWVCLTARLLPHANMDRPTGPGVSFIRVPVSSARGVRCSKGLGHQRCRVRCWERRGPSRVHGRHRPPPARWASPPPPGRGAPDAPRSTGTHPRRWRRP